MIGSKDMAYARAADIEEVVDLLSSYGPRAQILAGGTDLLVDLRSGRRIPEPDLLIDIKSVPELGAIDVNDQDACLTIGAAVPLNRIVEHPWIRHNVGGLAEAAMSVGTYQIRNRATLVGNLCNASPAADLAPVLLALDAELRVVDQGGMQSTPLRDFFVGVKKTSLASDAFVASIRISIPAGTRTAFVKQQRVQGHDLAIVNAGGAYVPDSDAMLIAVGSCSPTPVLLDPIVVRNVVARELVDHACQLADRMVCPIDDVRASSAYRRAVVPVLLERLVLRLLAESESHLYSEQGGGSCPPSR
ncbi:FAD binding domain-containing protein [Candidatus Bipolaricaulota bacterium]|nr:FAD binding domain-containing protein [Candidatus Bipolaricaulota bacterium]